MKLMSIKLLVLSTALVLLLAACGGDTAEPLPASTPYPTYTPLPTPAPAATSTAMPVITPLPGQPFVVENEATAVALREMPTPTVVPVVPATITPAADEIEEGVTCTLSGGEVVQKGWSGNGTGSNYCNQCRCLNAGLACTRMACPSVKLPATSTPMPPTATPTRLPTATLTPTQVPPTPTAVPTQSNPCAAAPVYFRKLCEEAMTNNPDSEASGSSSSDYYAQSYDPENIPQIANFNFTELDKYSKMSKLRSGVGHDYSPNTSEYDPMRKNCRSMKHYFVPMGVPLENALYSITPHAFEWMSIKFFAPADGTLTNVIYSQNEYGTEAKFSILSNQYPGYYFTYYHIALDPNLTEGMLVEAGEQIGTLGHEESWGEIAVEVRINSREIHLISFLQVATDDVLEMYKLRGMNTASDVIITKEQRDATPLACEDSEARFFEGSGREGASLDEQFMIWAFESSDNWFFFD